MIRRALLALLLGAVALAGAACSTVDGQRAQALLQQASEAQASVASMTFGIRLWGEMEGQSFTIKADGGAYVTGERAGDFVLDASAQAPSLPTTTFTVLSRDGAMWVGVDGRWQQLPRAAVSEGQNAELEQRFADFDLSRYVTDVSVTSGTTFFNEPVTKIVGVIDTAALFDGILGQLGGDVSQFGGGALPDDLSSHLGPTRAVLYISDETHLLKAALITMTIEDQGKTIELHVDYAVRSVNEPVEIPKPGLAA